MKKGLMSVIFYLLIIIIIFLSIYINKDYSYIYDKKIINNYSDLKKYKDYKFVTLNMSDVNETRYSLDDNGKRTIIYTKDLDKKSILIELDKTAVITKKTDLMYMKDHKNTTALKNDLSKEKNKFIDGYYTNINLKKNTDILLVKFYISIFLGLLSLMFMIINSVSVIFSKN